MSYDLRVWTTLPPEIGYPAATWLGSGPLAQGRGWLINAHVSARIEPEDVPEQVAEALPGIAHLVELTLEPIGAPASALTKLRTLAKAFATAAHGVIEDPQAGTIALGPRVQRLSSLGVSDDSTLLSMGFWYESGPMIDPKAATELLNILSRQLPEAVPARYGDCEPPQFRLDRDGRPHLESFLQQHWREFCVYYPSAPVADLHISQPQSIGPSRNGYRSGRVCIDIDVSAIAQPGWQTAVSQAWRELVRFMQPFYSDVRHLHHYSRSRGRYWVKSDTESHPVCSWWWSGVPPGPVYAIALGKPYLNLWPEFQTNSLREGSCVVHSTVDWRAGATPLSIPEAPASIRQVRPEYQINRDRMYPAIWPFASPRV